MNRRNLILIVILSIILLSWSANPPNGNSGAPFDRTCARSGCHTSVSSISGAVDIVGIPDEVEPGVSYDFSVILKVSSGSASRGGFQMVAIDSDENDAGTISDPGMNSALSSFQGRTYFEHQPAKNFDDNNEIQYTAKWTAPEGMSGDEATFYVSAMLVNGNGAPSGDTYVSINKTFTLKVQNQLQASITAQSDVLCNGESTGTATVMATGGSESYSYTWSNGELTATATMLSAGMHNVTVSDGVNESVTSTTIGEPDALSASIVVDQSLECAGTNNGALTAMGAGGTPPYTYLWNTGQSSASLTNLPTGLYNVTVNDANGCALATEVTLFASDVTPPVLDVVENIDLFLGENISVIDIMSLDDILISSEDNCDTDLSIDWSPKSFNCDDVGQAMLTITATDASGNRSSATVLVDVVDDVAPSLICISDVVNISSCAPFSYVAPSVQDNCNNFRLELISGQGINNEFPIGETRETYMVTDRSGNTATCEIIINNQPDINIDVQVSDISCAGTEDGSAQFVITGKNSPFSVELEGFAAADNLEEGLYSFTVTDFTGCTLSGSFEINEPDPVTISSVEVSRPTNSNSGDGSIDITVEGGTPPYIYSWMTEDEFFSDDEDLELLFPGEYVVEVTDSRGCLVTSELFSLEEITSINDPIINAKITVYPNPSARYLFVDVKDLDFDRGRLTIVNMNGQMVHQHDLKTETDRIDIQSLAGGVYVFKLDIDDEIITRPFWKLDD